MEESSGGKLVWSVEGGLGPAPELSLEFGDDAGSQPKLAGRGERHLGAISLKVEHGRQGGVEGRNEVLHRLGLREAVKRLADAVGAGPRHISVGWATSEREFD
jgi:hypothetical protein